MRLFGWRVLAVYALICCIRGFEYAFDIWYMGGVTVASLLKTLWLGVEIFICALPAFLIATWILRSTRSQPVATRAWKLAAALAAGAPIFAFGLYEMQSVSDPTPAWESQPWAEIAGFAMWVLTVGGSVVAMVLLTQRQADTEAALHAERIAAVRREQDWDEIRRRFLRSQIEPHFLFNALANVKRLYETQPASGRDLLGALEDYIRRALTTRRMDSRTVDDELSLTRAYLDIFAVRMGKRLRVELDVPETLRDAPLPPLMLGTLVENALKHGIAPRAEGGTIRIRVRGEGDNLLVEVSDDGVGFREASGTGIGLANTRARLASLFGARARLDLARNPGGGVVATLRMPREAIP